jgi:hypothetical protein
MAAETDPLELLGREPDSRLLGEDLDELPASAGQPPAPLPESPVRRRVVRAGAAMTGATLIGGSGLALLGLVEAISGGALGWFLVLILGVVLVATHWGWVHVAELTGNRIETHRTASLEDRRRQWLLQIEPYPRWEVSTQAGEDGSITVVTVCHRPVPRTEGTYSFLREEVSAEVHSGDEPAAAVTERAELLRRRAAAETEQARQQFEAARDAYERTLLAHDDEQQRRAALRAASEALSERINANLRDPPLIE